MTNTARDEGMEALVAELRERAGQRVAVAIFADPPLMVADMVEWKAADVIVSLCVIVRLCNTALAATGARERALEEACAAVDGFITPGSVADALKSRIRALQHPSPQAREPTVWSANDTDDEVCRDWCGDSRCTSSLGCRRKFPKPFGAAAPTAALAEMPVEAWHPMSEARKDGPCEEVILETRNRNGSLNRYVSHWAYGGGEDQPRFGPGWFHWNGYCFVETPGNPVRWRALTSPGGNHGG